MLTFVFYFQATSRLRSKSNFSVIPGLYNAMACAIQFQALGRIVAGVKWGKFSSICPSRHKGRR